MPTVRIEIDNDDRMVIELEVIPVRADPDVGVVEGVELGRCRLLLDWTEATTDLVTPHVRFERRTVELRLVDEHAYEELIRAFRKEIDRAIEDALDDGRTER